VREDHREVSPLSREGMSSVGGLTFYAPGDGAPLAFSLILPPLSRGRSRERCTPPLGGVRGRGDNGVATFRRCTRVGEAAPLRRWLGICAAGVRGPRTWPRTILVQAIQQLALVRCDDAYGASPGLAIPLDPGSRPPWLLAVAVAAHALAALRRGGYVVPGLTIPVGYRWQNSGWGRRSPSTSTQLHRRPRVAPERQRSPAAAAGETSNLEKPQCRRGRVQRLVRPGILNVPFSC
jgi:hypothetical protein